MAYVILGSCVNDSACVDVCPVDCIHPLPSEPDFATAEMLYIDPNVCVNCNACREACPVDAVRSERDLTGQQVDFLDINARYFAEPATSGNPECG